MTTTRPALPDLPAAEAERHSAGARVGISRPHESAHLHVAGAAPYIDDLPETAGTLHAALGLSPVAHGRLLGIDLATLRAQPGVVAVFTGSDFPGVNDCGRNTASHVRNGQLSGFCQRAYSSRSRAKALS